MHVPLRCNTNQRQHAMGVGLGYTRVYKKATSRIPDDTAMWPWQFKVVYLKYASCTTLYEVVRILCAQTLASRRTIRRTGVGFI